MPLTENSRISVVLHSLHWISGQAVWNGTANTAYRFRPSACESSNRIREEGCISSILPESIPGTVSYTHLYRHGTWIKHHPPGKRWDCLYTWDSGFIGLGLLELEPKLAEYVLDLYLSQPDNQDFAFLMHGSPVPVQAYLYLELLQRAEDKEKLLDWYPRLRRYYMFLAGKTEGSATDPFNRRLTTTFDYFYHCSGCLLYTSRCV